MPTLSFAWPASAILFLVLVFWWFMSYKNLKPQILYSYLAVVIDKIYVAKNVQKNKDFFKAIFFSLLVLGLMRPQFIGKPIDLEQSGRNLMLAVDISESMQTPDMKIKMEEVDRLTAVKAVLSDFILRRKGDYLGLVLFGSESFLHAPLSSDHETIKKFLYEAQIGFLGPKTAIGDAILLSVKKLAEQEGEKVLILLTDGQHNAGIITPLEAAKIAQDKKVKIYIIGVGSNEMLIDSFFGKRSVNPSQDLEAGESTLKEIARLTGGLYFRSTDTNSLEKIYQELDKLEPTIQESQKITPKKELFYWPLSLAFFMLLLMNIYKFFSLRRVENL